ncbi:hypothetical protein CDD80_4714 [Ophiocordyceps camponoti-rufipedis]|uniref:Major facilitator superfamily (MFS) profile domain-containing protein n=1 Tax=Ophiocordyceps camponoti-rufipedis TaxID=2004952 RepID=A0A2C5ZEN5_9HYPO|nr:hypothetical protein CDD80_4714 [Ophiocordyceps camponoti-rufipedis]
MADSPTRAKPDAAHLESRDTTMDLSGLQHLSVYEQKCALVSRELDHQGMGRYQWYIWFLCGFGYFLDLLWAQAFALVLSPLQQELGFSNNQSGNISMSFNVGLTTGAFFWGFMSDIIGRRWAFNLTCLLSSVFGLCLGAANNYNTFLVLTAFIGFGVGGNIPVDGAIFLEFAPQRRQYMLACLSIFQPAGVIACSALAFAFIPTHSCSPNFSEPNPLPSCYNVSTPDAACCSREANMGWRYLLYTLGALTLAVFILRTLIFRCRETPRFLIYRGQDARAIRTLEYVAKVNKQKCQISLQLLDSLQNEYDLKKARSQMSPPSPMSPLSPTSPLSPLSPSENRSEFIQKSKKQKLGQELGRFKLLFATRRMTSLTILTWLTYILDFGGFNIAGFYLPRILALKNGQESISLTHTYASYIYCYVPGILAVLLGAYASQIPALGQKWTMVASSGLMATSIFLLSRVNSAATSEGLFALEYFFQSTFNAVLYGWTPQAFPAPIRGTACGVASFWGRLFGIVSPLIAQHLYGQASGNRGNVDGVLYLAGGVTMGCVLTTALLPRTAAEEEEMKTRDPSYEPIASPRV